MPIGYGLRESFFFFFFDMSTQEGEMRFELDTSAS